MPVDKQKRSGGPFGPATVSFFKQIIIWPDRDHLASNYLRMLKVYLLKAFVENLYPPCQSFYDFLIFFFVSEMGIAVFLALHIRSL